MKKLVAITALAAMLATMVVSAPVTAQSTKIHVPDDYATIQEAVASANSGDTIIVTPGTYNESVNVHKTLTIEAAGLMTVVNGGTGNAFLITAAGVIVEGFDARACAEEAGFVIGINGAENVIISNNKVTGGMGGIVILDATHSEVIGNEVSDSSDTGISVEATSDNCTIKENKVSDCSLAGIVVAGANSEVKENEVSGGDEVGILVEGSTGSIIKENKVSGGEKGIVLIAADHNTVKENEVSGCDKSGISAWGVIGNNIKENKVSECGGGIHLSDACSVEVIENELFDNEKAAIMLNWSTYSLIAENEVYDNGWGICLRFNSDENRVIENEVYDSTEAGIQTEDSSGNFIRENRVLGSDSYDLLDDSAPWPLENTWVDNECDTKNWVEP